MAPEAVAAEPSVSAVVCAYTERRLETLVAAVRSLQEQTYGVKETIVVIDHNPALLARVRELSGVWAIENDGPQGLAGARNAGLAAATGEVVAFLDDDAAARPSWLGRMIAAYADPAVLGTGATVLPRWQDGAPPRWLPAEFYWTVGCSYEGLPSATAPVRNPIGAAMAFRREVLDRVGGFNTDTGRVGTIPLGCEETELSIRAHGAFPGGKVLHVAEAEVDHLVPSDRLTWRYFLSRCWAEGISKAVVARAVGRQDALSSERRYAFVTLPRGFARGLMGVFSGDAAGPSRALAIALGLSTTALGYARGRLAALHLDPRRA